MQIGAISPSRRTFYQWLRLSGLLAPFGFHILNASCNSSAGFSDSHFRNVCEVVLSLRTIRCETKVELCFPLLMTARTGVGAKCHVSGI